MIVVHEKNITLIELSTRQHNHLKEHCIHLYKIRHCNKNEDTYYYGIQSGEAIFAEKKGKKSGCNKKNCNIDLHKTKGGHILITAWKKDCLQIAPNTYCSETVMPFTQNGKCDQSTHVSGFLF